MRTRRKKKKRVEKGTLAGTVALSNKHCPNYYRGAHCPCPLGRCWYDEQLGRRAKSLLALTPEEWRRRLTNEAELEETFFEKWSRVVASMHIEITDTEGQREFIDALTPGGRPDFAGFVEALRAEADGTELSGLKGTALTDVERLLELANRVETVGKSLGFIS